MLSFKKSPTTNNIAIIQDPEEGYNHNKILFIDSSKIDAPASKKRIDLEGDEQFVIYPTVKPERVYIVGPNGSGKSWQAGKYCESYNKCYPKNKIIMLSDGNINKFFSMFIINKENKSIQKFLTRKTKMIKN